MVNSTEQSVFLIFLFITKKFLCSVLRWPESTAYLMSTLISSLSIKMIKNKSMDKMGNKCLTFPSKRVDSPIKINAINP